MTLQKTPHSYSTGWRFSRPCHHLRMLRDKWTAYGSTTVAVSHPNWHFKWHGQNESVIPPIYRYTHKAIHRVRYVAPPTPPIQKELIYNWTALRFATVAVDSRQAASIPVEGIQQHIDRANSFVGSSVAPSGGRALTVPWFDYVRSLPSCILGGATHFLRRSPVAFSVM